MQTRFQNKITHSIKVQHNKTANKSFRPRLITYEEGKPLIIEFLFISLYYHLFSRKYDFNFFLKTLIKGAVLILAGVVFQTLKGPLNGYCVTML